MRVSRVMGQLTAMVFPALISAIGRHRPNGLQHRFPPQWRYA